MDPARIFGWKLPPGWHGLRPRLHQGERQPAHGRPPAHDQTTAFRAGGLAMDSDLQGKEVITSMWNKRSLWASGPSLVLGRQRLYQERPRYNKQPVASCVPVPDARDERRTPGQ